MNNHVKQCVYLGLVSVLALFSNPALAATIVVDETTCTLVDAITAANTDSPVGGCTGGSGADTIELTTDITLTDVNNSYWGPNALPQVTSPITIEGRGSVIERSAGAPDFRFLQVAATLELNDLTLRNGGGALLGGAVHNRGTTTISNSTLSGNSAARGGAIHNYRHLYVENSAFSGNSASQGGAIYQEYGSNPASSRTSVTNSTFSGNSASVRGGAIVNGEEAVVTLTNCTLSGNSASIGAAISSDSESFLTTITNTIVANSFTGSNCAGPISTPYPLSFADDDSCGAQLPDITPGVDFDTNLADNGGPTLTHALLPWSVAIDAAGECGLDTDQRGFPRDDGQCDSGSFEFQVGGDDGGGDVPASSPLGLLALLAILMTVSWVLVRPERRTRYPTRG